MTTSIKKNTLHIWGCAILSLVLFVLTVTLLATTVNRKVSQTEYVVMYDHYNMKFKGIKEQGTYTTGVGWDFIHFQRTLRDLKMGTVECLTVDKIVLELDVKLQIRMVRENLIDVVLRQFSDADMHDRFLKSISRSILVDTCLEFRAEDYYLQRSTVDVKMFHNLQDQINNSTYGANVEFFQLNHIQLPAALVEVITEKQNIQQEIITAGNDRENEIISATTALLEAEQNAQVIIIEANNTATVLQNKADQRREIIKTEWQNRGEAYGSVVDTLMLDAQGFLSYLNAELLRHVNRAVVN